MSGEYAQDLVIDYSEVETPFIKLAQEDWDPPRHVFFGKKDARGKPEKEPTYAHIEYPRMMYGKRGNKIIARIVNNEEERKILGNNWALNPAEFGLITQPSREQLLEIEAQRMKKEDEAMIEKIAADVVPTGDAVESPRRGRPPNKAD